MDTNCVPSIMILVQVVIQVFCSQCPFWLKCLSLKKGHNSVKYSQSKSGHLHHVPKQYAYHDPISSGSPDILLTRLLYYTRCQSRKRDIIQSNTYRKLPKVNQVIHTLDTIYLPNIMILARAILQRFC